VGVAAGRLLSCALLVTALPQAQEPVFRGSVDVIPLTVHVVDQDGRPLAGLSVDKFEVTLGGHRRRVVSAELIRYGSPRAATVGPVDRPIAPAPAATASPELPSSSGRLFMLAIDNLSFAVGASRGVANAAQRFVTRLQASDRVGLFTYPLGPKIDPTTDHAAISKALDQVVGERPARGVDRFNLQPSEIVDLSARYSGSRDPQTQLIVESHCGRPAESQCASDLTDDARGQAIVYEGQAAGSMGMLRSLIRFLGKVPGEKIVVLVSAGMVVSDRPGGRPDLSQIGTDMGREAAAAGVAVYTLFIDASLLESNSAENRFANRNPAGTGRDAAILARWLDQFSATAGGSLITDAIGSGESAYDRILNETQAYYLLGVEPVEADRDGRARELRVKVNARDATIRGRAWAVVPKK